MFTGNYNLNPHNKQVISKAIGVQDIREAIAKIKKLKSFGSDKISSPFLKFVIPFVKRSLALIFNTALNTSHIPD